MDRKIHLWIRRSKNYLDGNIDKNVNIPSFPTFIHNVRVWNLFFKMDYMTFRKRMASIAALSYKPNEFDGIFEYSDYEALKKNNDIFLVPVDEDDWIHPSLVEVLRKVNLGDNDVVRWNVIDVDTAGIPSDITRRGLLRTRSCSYGVLSDYPWRLINSHVQIHHYLAKNADKLMDLPDFLSVKVGHVSSFSYLWRIPAEKLFSFPRERKLIKHSKYLKDYKNLVDLYNELLMEFYDSFKM